MPLTFNSSGLPCTEVKIEGVAYPLIVDLGDKLPLMLSKTLLDKIAKKPEGVKVWKDAQGTSYESTSFLIPEIKIGNFTLTDISASQENEECNNNGVIWRDQGHQVDERFGKIGRPLLEKRNLFLDFPNARAISCNNIQELKKMGFILSQIEKIPFQRGRTGIILQAQSDIGTIRLSISTGTNISLLRTSTLKQLSFESDWRGLPVFNTSRFAIGNTDFGSTNLYLLEITPELHEIDGVLGMDFLKQHTIYIDFSNRLIYIGTPQTLHKGLHTPLPLSTFAFNKIPTIKELGASDRFVSLK